MARDDRKYDRDAARVEKFSKAKKRGRRGIPAHHDPKDEFERSEEEWELGGATEGFAARVVEVHKRYAFVSPEPKIGTVDTRDVWLATIARKQLITVRAERNFVAVGDRVLRVPGKGQVPDAAADLPQCVMHNISPRKTRLSRNDPHTPGLLHVLAANMDQLMIVASYLSPSVKWGLIDRYLVLAESEGIRSIIVLNKKDLLSEDPKLAGEAEEMRNIYLGLGYSVFDVQANAPGAKDAPEFVQLKNLLAGQVTLLSGHSGVGKSSVVNLFKPEIVQTVEPDSNIFYKGRHTTSFASFIRLGSGGYVIDTPGIRSFTFEDKGPIELSHCFVEMRPFLGQCEFRECRHIDEPDCVIRAAVEDGKISRWRYKSYLGILLGSTGREGRIRDLPLTD